MLPYAGLASDFCIYISLILIGLLELKSAYSIMPRVCILILAVVAAAAHCFIAVILLTRAISEFIIAIDVYA